MGLNPAYARSVAALEALEGQGMKLGLERTEALLAELGAPQDGLRGVLVAGTNGKGSVCATVDAMLRAGGRRTVLLTKPHLASWRERIVVDGEPVSQAQFVDLIDTTLAAAARLGPDHGGVTVFEAITAAGILAARRAEPDALICEVGLGGRLDSTNVLDLGVAVVTTIGLDHRAQLGDDIAGIAAEKAAIIKPGNHVVTAAEEPALGVIEAAARRANATGMVNARTAMTQPIEDLGRHGGAVTLGALRLQTPLLGEHQGVNLAVAAETVRALRQRGYGVDDAAMARGAASVTWPGRLQWLDGSPPLLVDSCHNTPAVAATMRALLRLREGRRTVAVFGVMADKDVEDMLAVLRPGVDAVVFTAPQVPRATDPGELARRWGPGTATAPTVAAALQVARADAGPDGLVLACGSLYVAGEALAAVAAAGAATGLRAWD